MKQIDRYDIMIAVGAVLTAVGVWLYEPALVLVVAGVSLVKAGMWLSRPARGDR